MNPHHQSFIDQLKNQYPIIKGNVPSKVIDHIKNCLVEPTHLSSICVDGGYTQTQAMGELARAGADLGLSMALLALGFSPQDSFDFVLHFRLQRNQKYGWHTDTHQGHGGVIIGCGHANAALMHSKDYGLEKGDMRQLIDIVQNYQNQHPDKTLYHILAREHQEEGILLVTHTQITLQPWGKKDAKDETDTNQFFVYDQARDKKLLTELWQFILRLENKTEKKKLKIDNQVCELSNLEKIVDNHTQTTLALLASSQDKPIYGVGIARTQNKLVINHLGFAPHKN